jgi:DUF4097 and DUF4098 domain-containing protein YvlB
MKSVVLWLSAIGIVSLIIGIGLIGNGGFVNLRTYIINETKISDIEGISKIHIKAVSADVKVSQSESDTIKANLIGRVRGHKQTEARLDVNKEGEALVINGQVRDTAVIFDVNFGSTDLRLNIELPKNYTNGLTITTTSGDIELAESFGDLSVKTVSGNIEIEQVGGNFDANSTSGNINVAKKIGGNSQVKTISGDVDLGRVEGNLMVNTTSGNIEVTNEVFGNVNIHTVSGNSILNPGKEASFELSFDTISGRYINNLPAVSKNSSQRSIRSTVGTGKNGYNIKSSSGDLEIN